ncbi:hypothetical protein A5707_07210 [Mycobacterium kyorinense]|uniref:Uncharacterized protein n=1 Tax=Mycobacterium kyorinense TaxID=487514 RepID=A0A1A2YW79_9MYCO|nr:hypothetical protein [Mycobacterium kyorinense]OBI41502.1 hypothetical protein A5707_07210 [Mycobacterium kyorinense]
MTGSGAKSRWGRALRYTFGAVLCLLTVVASRAGLQWYWSVVVLCGAFLIIVGRRRIIRAGVTRTADEIVCRYIPWYEGNAYYLTVLLPLTGVAMVAAGNDPGNPAWLRFGGIILLVLTPLFMYSFVRMWRRCLLCITPSRLTVRLGTLGAELIEIGRERIESIEPKLVPNGLGAEWLQVEIAYRALDLSGDAGETVVVGLGLTVEPVNLVKALMAWKDAANETPSALLDRIERILRGREMAGV